MGIENMHVARGEFEGMSKEALLENIDGQEMRISSRVVDRDEILELKALIERMRTRVTEMGAYDTKK